MKKKSYDTDLMNDSNKKMIAVFFETEAEILHGAIERYLPMEGRNIFEELQNAFNLRKLFYNKIITSVNTHFCLINDDLERTCLAIEENVESYDISSFKQIWLRERKEESFETLAPRKLYRFLGIYNQVHFLNQFVKFVLIIKRDGTNQIML